METSKNQRAGEIVGFRTTKKFVLVIDEPCELGYHCPVCEYEILNPTLNGQCYDERLTRSEYNGFLWCSVCNKDYPSCLCMPDIDKAIDIYLDVIEGTKKFSNE